MCKLQLVEKSKSDLSKVRKKSQRSKTSDKYDLKEKQVPIEPQCSHNIVFFLMLNVFTCQWESSLA